MIIDRNIINKEIEFTDSVINSNIVFNYNDICLLINRIKNTLLEHGAKKGDTLALVHHTINAYHIAAVIASCELGLKFLVFDMPPSYESLPYTKMGTYKPINFTIIDDTNNSLVKEMVRRYGGIRIFEDMIVDNNSYNQPWEIFPEDELMITSSSGTTNWSKKVIFSHKEIFNIAYRNVSLCKYKENDKVMQTKNLHHGASLMITLLPSLIKCKYHIGAAIADYKYIFNRVSKRNRKILEKIQTEHYNRIMIVSETILDEFVKLVEKQIYRFKNTLIVTLYASTVSPKLLNYCEKYNMEFISCFGSQDAKTTPLTINHITKDSNYIPMSIGKLEDDFYQIHSFENGVFKFTNIDWNEPHLLEDKFDLLEDGTMILKNRILDENQELRQKTAEIVNCDFAVVQNGDRKYLALFDKNYSITDDLKNVGYNLILHIDKEIFSVETKLNYDALRGHFIYYDH